RIRVGLVQGLNGADQVVAEEADGAARERRQPLYRREAVGGEALGDGPVWVGGLARAAFLFAQPAFAPAQHRAGRDADERVAADLPLLGGLEQKAGRARRLPGPQLEEGGDRRLAVVDEARADRDDIAPLGEGAGLLQAWLEIQLGASGDAH